MYDLLLFCLTLLSPFHRLRCLLPPNLVASNQTPFPECKRRFRDRPTPVARGPRPVAGQKRSACASCALRGDGNGHAVCERIVDRRVAGAEADDFLQLIVRHVGADLEAGANSLVALANRRIEFKKTAQVEIAFER